MNLLKRRVGYSPALTPDELAAVERLRAAGALRGVHYKIDPGTKSGILLFEDGEVAGYMTADHFGGAEVESAALVAGAAAWEAMLPALLAHARERGADRLLLIADPGDADVVARLQSRGLSPAFTEYRMALDPALFAPVALPGLALRPATGADREAVIALDRAAFGGALPAYEGAGADLANTQIILLEGAAVGKLRVDTAGGTHGIYGVVVVEGLRGRGIGGAALSAALIELLAEGGGDIYLEVDSENPAACHLYQKLGFRVASSFDYYPMAL